MTESKQANHSSMSKPFSLAVKAAIADADGRYLLIRRSAHNRPASPK